MARTYTHGSGPAHAVVPPAKARVTARWGGGTGYWQAQAVARNSLRVTQGSAANTPKHVRVAQARKGAGLPVRGRTKRHHVAVGRFYR